jgi:hypothetical protein
MTREAVLMESLPYVLDLAGTFVFALSGAMAGVTRSSVTSRAKIVVSNVPKISMVRRIRC